MRNVGVAIPSYNESENVFILINKILSVLPNAKIVVVDDSKLYENKRLLDSLKKIDNAKRKQVKVLSREKKLGRGSAVRMGLLALLQNKDILYMFEMDADLSHNPEEFLMFFEKLEKENADVVIGSRYLDKSKTVKWPIWRLILSKLYNKGINFWLGLSLTDYTNGFRLYKRDAVEFLSRVALREKGFIALSEIAYRLKMNNFKLVEVPITFTDRTQGKSSANAKEYVSALIGIVRIKVVPFRYLRKDV